MIDKKKNEFVVFILYDSIQNSVFEGQVLQPLLNKAQKEKSNILLISIENKTPSKEIIKKIESHNCIELIIIKKNLFLGMISLNSTIKRVHAFLKKLSKYILYARGPHAGWISLHASKNTQCQSITIQARGVLPEEYAFVHRHKKKPFSWIHALRKKHFEKLEKLTYSYKNPHVPVTIEAVSKALKYYLIKKYKAQKPIIIATQDIPKLINEEKRKTWRAAIRTKLGLSSRTHIYCYNGSAKAWQCPEQVIQFFVDEQKKKKNCFLLVLTQDNKEFKKLIQKKNIDPSHYYVCSIAHQEVFQYLAACDTGLLFREKNIINWVSRPTKLLEYQAAHLKIIHNNTIELLTR